MYKRQVEIRAAAALDFMILEPVTETVITGVKEEPLDLKALQALPGIAGYIVPVSYTHLDVYKRQVSTYGSCYGGCRSGACVYLLQFQTLFQKC